MGESRLSLEKLNKESLTIPQYSNLRRRLSCIGLAIPYKIRHLLYI